MPVSRIVSDFKLSLSSRNASRKPSVPSFNSPPSVWDPTSVKVSMLLSAGMKSSCDFRCIALITPQSASSPTITALSTSTCSHMASTVSRQRLHTRRSGPLGCRNGLG